MLVGHINGNISLLWLWLQSEPIIIIPSERELTRLYVMAVWRDEKTSSSLHPHPSHRSQLCIWVSLGVGGFGLTRSTKKSVLTPALWRLRHGLLLCWTMCAYANQRWDSGAVVVVIKLCWTAEMLMVLSVSCDVQCDAEWREYNS